MTGKIITLSLLFAVAFSISCNRTKTVVLSKFPNGKAKEVIVLDLPITNDSSGLKSVYFENGQIQAYGQSKNGKRQGKWICNFLDGKPEWIASFKDDIENGEVTCYKANGEWRKNSLTNGIRNGKFVSYFYDPIDSLYCYSYGQYVNGLEQGPRSP